MRWKPVFFAACIMAAVMAELSQRGAAAQGVDDIDYTIDISTDRSMWALLFDTRIRKRRSPFDFLSGGMPDRLTYFGGLDASRWSFGAYAGVQWAPAGFNRDGFILRMLLSESIERYTTGIRNYDTQIGRGSIMPGYMFRIDNLEIQLLAGLDAEADFFFVDQRASKWRTKFGARATTDIWWEPTRLLMLQYALSGTTIDNGYSTRIAGGVRLFDAFWVGPEATLSNDYFSQQTRFGAHITGLRTGPYEWSFAAGHVQDSFGRAGAYGRFGVMLRPPRAPFFEN